MGSPADLTDLSHGSIIYWLWLLFLLLSNSLNSFISFFSTTLPRFRFRRPNRIISADGDSSSSSSCAAVDEQLSVNHRFSIRYSTAARAGSGCEEECVVCLSSLSHGESVRELDCRHVFHEGCLDGWLRRRNFTCPVCRSPVMLCRPAARWPGIARWIGTWM